MLTLLKIQCVFGIIIIISPWIFGYYEVTSARWINVLLGFAITCLALFGILGYDDGQSGNSEKKKV